MKPYYDDGQITIYHADCRDVLPLLGPVDLVLTDPPFGVGKAEWDKLFPSFLWNSLDAPVVGVLPGVSNLAGLPDMIGPAKYRWMLNARILNGMTRGAFGFGNWIPCAVWAEEGITLMHHQQDCADVVIRGDMPEHPCPKPLEAMRWFLERLPGATVLDPFMGSGTTLRAAKDLGRKAIGVEVCEEYCAIAVDRLRQGVLL